MAITLVGFFASAAAATNLSDPLAQWLSGFDIGWLAFIAPGLAPVVITLVVSYLSIVVGELVPKRIALADAERVSKMVAGPLGVFQKIASPLVALTSASANGLSRLFGSRTPTSARTCPKTRSGSWSRTTTSCSRTRSA